MSNIEEKVNEILGIETAAENAVVEKKEFKPIVPRVEDKDKTPPSVVSPVPQNNEDGSDYYIQSGFYGQYVDHLVLGDYGPLPDPSPAGRETAAKRLAGGPRVEKPKGFFSPQQAFDWHKENDPRAGSSDGEIWAAVENLYRTNWDGILIPKTDPEMWWQNGRTALKEGDFMWHSVKNISCKTLVLRGEISTVLDKEQAEKMAEAIPNGNGIMREVPKAGHGLHGENMEGALEILREFLAS